MREKSNMIQQLFSGLAMVMYTGEDEKEINNIFDGSFRAELNSVVAPYRQLFVFHVIRFFVESLHELEKIVRNKNLFDIPNERKIHNIVVPRLGGIAFVPVVFLILLLLFFPLRLFLLVL